MIETLPAVTPPPADAPTPPSDGNHPMRVLAQRIAFEPGFWTPEQRRRVAARFDDLAPTWPHHDFPGVLDPIGDAFARGLPLAPAAERRRLLDLGGGNGRATALMAQQVPDVVLVDLSAQMLANVRGDVAPRVQADASELPFADGAVDVVVLANMFLFPGELDRVLSPDGVVVWVNSFGPQTPIHLSTAEVDGSLPGDWSAVESTAGVGSWSVHWRAR